MTHANVASSSLFTSFIWLALFFHQADVPRSDSQFWECLGSWLPEVVMGSEGACIRGQEGPVLNL